VGRRQAPATFLTVAMDALITHFRRMAAYNRAANTALYDAVGKLGRDEFVRPRPAFFGSIRGVLNHMIIGDRLWLTRFEGGEVDTADLDAILYEEFADLRAARIVEDARIVAMADGLTSEFLAGEIRYFSYTGRYITDPNSVTVAHFFNHQTHHRGQIHTMLTAAGARPDDTDLFIMPGDV